jgi:hypothetical protein
LMRAPATACGPTLTSPRFTSASTPAMRWTQRVSFLDLADGTNRDGLQGAWQVTSGNTGRRRQVPGGSHDLVRENR